MQPALEWTFLFQTTFPWDRTILPLAAYLPACSGLMGYWSAQTVICCSVREMTLLSFQQSTATSKVNTFSYMHCCTCELTLTFLHWGKDFYWLFLLHSLWHHDSIILHGLLQSCPPLAWALALLLVGEMSDHFVSHPHMDHIVKYSLALCPWTLLVGSRTLIFHRLWQWTILGHLTHLCLITHPELKVYKLIYGALVHSQWGSLQP